MLSRIINFFRPKKRRQPRRKNLRIHHEGNFHHLGNIYQELNTSYFNDLLDLHITWIGNRSAKPRTRVTFGSYSPELRLIRIHRRLDQEHVPDYFIRYVVYHEMLHHLYPPIIRKGERNQIHHAEFLEKEKLFNDYHLAVKFEKESLYSWFR